jgi:serine/threonine-protein kinase RIM15
MEYGGGGDFDMLITKYKDFDDNIIQLFVAEIILGLEYLHLKKIYHKDVKPKNIIITSNVKDNLILGSF